MQSGGYEDLLKRAKGYYATKSKLYQAAQEAVDKALKSIVAPAWQHFWLGQGKYEKGSVALKDPVVKPGSRAGKS